MRSPTAAILALALTTAQATFYNGGIRGSGTYYQSAYGLNAPDDNGDLPAFQSGASHPNATNWAYFTGIIWRTNVSQIAVSSANTQPPNGTSIPNPHVVTTTFSLEWQGNSSGIGDALQQRGAVAPYGCIQLIDGLSLQANVTGRYTAKDNGTCDDALGTQCQKDYLAALKVGSDGACPGILSKEEMPASCKGTLGAAERGLGGLVENLESLHFLNSNNNNTQLQSGQGFAHIVSDAYSGPNATALQFAESRLQILVVKGLNSIICQKVNATTTVDSSSTPSGPSPSTTTTNAASSIEKMSYAAMGVGAMAAVVFGL